MLPLSRPYINSENNHKRDIADYLNSVFPNRNHSLCFSARQGLDLIYKNLFVNKGVLTVAVTPLTCIEAILPIVSNGHKIHFVDIDDSTLNMKESLIPRGLDVVQAVHFGGNPQDMDTIAKASPNVVIEDCAQSFGSNYKNKSLGGFGDYSVFSFMKNFYSLGGGAIVSREIIQNNKGTYPFGKLPTKYRYIKRSFESRLTFRNSIEFYLLKLLLSLKPDNTTMVINNSYCNKTIIESIEKQLYVAEWIINKRKENAGHLLSKISNPRVKQQIITENSIPNYLRLFFTHKSKTTKEIIQYLRNYGIGANHLTQNLLNPYQERFDNNPLFSKFISKSNLKNYFDIHDRVFCIPISPSLSDSEINTISYYINKL